LYLFPRRAGRCQQSPLTLAFATDTSTPQPIVPVFLIHSLKEPFCDNPHCVCQVERVRKNMVLLSITRGEVMLYPADRFAAPLERGEA
jgi:hypothetical protein